MSLRDALLKAGKVNKAQAQRADAEARAERKKAGGGHQAEQAKAAEAAEREAARRAAQAEENRLRAEAARVAREDAERRMRIGNLITSWTRRPRRDARQKWYFVRSSGSVGLVLVDAEQAAALEFGAMGIVELPSDRGAVRVVAAEGVRKLVEEYAEGVRFYVGRDAIPDPLTCPPPRP